MPRALSLAVIGAGDAPPRVRRLAFEVGREAARRGAIIVSGGLGGVMAGAAAGARAGGGHAIGILPTYNLDSANRHVDFRVATGMGEARNVLVVASADAVVALEGESGTLSEIGLAMKLRRPVVALRSWHNIEGIERAATPQAAVELALRLARARNRRK
jgi:hypothetical protein